MIGEREKEKERFLPCTIFQASFESRHDSQERTHASLRGTRPSYRTADVSMQPPKRTTQSRYFLRPSKPEFQNKKNEKKQKQKRMERRRGRRRRNKKKIKNKIKKDRREKDRQKGFARKNTFSFSLVRKRRIESNVESFGKILIEQKSIRTNVSIFFLSKEIQLLTRRLHQRVRE